MSEFAAGPRSGVHDGDGSSRSGGGPPPVLLAALGVALLIAIVLSAVLMRGGGDGSPPGVRPAGVAPAPSKPRYMLTVTFDGAGGGRVVLSPGAISCSQACAHEFTQGTRVSVTAEAGSGSRFGGWGDACDGDGDCSFTIADDRELSVRFDDATPAPQADPDAGLPCDEDPDCADDAGGGEDVAPAPAPDCLDGRDNDGDGLTDAAQDPGCTDGRSEGSPTDGTAPATTSTTAAPPAAAANECADGRDNDGDGLIDTAQDPGCENSRSEAG